LNTFKYETNKVILDKYTIVEADGVSTIFNWLQFFSPEDLKREFTGCGFSIDGIYSDVRGTPYNHLSSEFAVVAKAV